MRRVVKIVTVTAFGASGCLKVGWIAVNQFAALEGEGFKETERAPPMQLYRVVAGEAVNGAPIKIDADVALLREASA